MKTLIVKYLPNGSESKTKKLLDLFLQEIKNQNIEVLDLLKETPPIFDEASIKAYYKRNYDKKELSAQEAKLLEKNDQLVSQLKASDILIMAYPMHNFSMPAAVKAYLDSVELKGETFEVGEKMMKGKKVLTIFSSGGVYSEALTDLDRPNFTSLPFFKIAGLAQANFSFMGFDEIKTIGTSLRDKETEVASFNEMKKKICEVVKRWYK